MYENHRLVINKNLAKAVKTLELVEYVNLIHMVLKNKDIISFLKYWGKWLMRLHALLPVLSRVAQIGHWGYLEIKKQKMLT